MASRQERPGIGTNLYAGMNTAAYSTDKSQQRPNHALFLAGATKNPNHPLRFPMETNHLSRDRSGTAKEVPRHPPIHLPIRQGEGNLRGFYEGCSTRGSPWPGPHLDLANLA